MVGVHWVPDGFVLGIQPPVNQRGLNGAKQTEIKKTVRQPPPVLIKSIKAATSKVGERPLTCGMFFASRSKHPETRIFSRMPNSM